MSRFNGLLVRCVTVREKPLKRLLSICIFIGLKAGVNDNETDPFAGVGYGLANVIRSLLSCNRGWSRHH